jgi:hypothetical protein
MLPDSPARGGKECPPIAIIGMALRLPGGMSSAEDSWKFLEIPAAGRPGNAQLLRI